MLSLPASSCLLSIIFLATLSLDFSFGSVIYSLYLLANDAIFIDFLLLLIVKVASFTQFSLIILAEVAYSNQVFYHSHACLAQAAILTHNMLLYLSKVVEFKSFYRPVSCFIPLIITFDRRVTFFVPLIITFDRPVISID